VSVTGVMLELGGIASRAQLIHATSRSEVDSALAAGDIVTLARGRYALPAADEAAAAAHRLTGIASHQSAALHWGWAVKTAPERPHVSLPKNRNLSLEQRRGVEIHRAALAADDISGVFTSRDRTLVDCLRVHELGEGLAVADSALRDGLSPSWLAALARDIKGPGGRQARRIADEARSEAANPFESALRAIALDVAGLRVRPQVAIRSTAFLGRPDLVDEHLRVVLEADSFEWHGDRAALRRDTKRYNSFVVNGWLVLRFAWEDVMFEPRYVTSVLDAVVAERTERACWQCRSA
jgi:very-short-patch-repair endonuclease